MSSEPNSDPGSDSEGSEAPSFFQDPDDPTMDELRRAVAETPVGHKALPKWLAGLGSSHLEQYNQNGQHSDDLELALSHGKAAVAAASANDPNLFAYLWTLAACYTVEYHSSGDMADLDAVIQNRQAAVDHMPTDYQEDYLPQWLHTLAMSLGQRYKETGDLQDLESALQNCQMAVTLTSEDHPDHPEFLQYLALCFRDRYRKLGDLKDLKAELLHRKSALKLQSEGHPGHTVALQQLARCSRDLYISVDTLENLEATLQNIQAALNVTPENHQAHVYLLKDLAEYSQHQYHRIGSLDSLKKALQSNEKAVAVIPNNNPDHPRLLENLINLLKFRYPATESTDDQSTLKNIQMTVGLIPEDHKEHPEVLQHLASHLTQKYQRWGNLEDMEASLQMSQEAVASTEKDSPAMADRLTSVAVAFSDRYLRLRDLKDLESALHNDQAAVALTPKDHPDLPARLQSLGVSFSDRYEQLGDLKDLEAALEHKGAAVKLTYEDDPQTPRMLQSLALSLLSRYARLGRFQDLKYALENNQKAVELTPNKSPGLHSALQNWSVSLNYLYKKSGDIKDLELCLEKAKAAVELTPKDHPELPRRLHGWAAFLHLRYLAVPDLNDLDAAIHHNQAAIDLTDKKHPDLPSRLQSLGLYLSIRYQKLGNDEDLEKSFKNYSISLGIPTSTLDLSWQAALEWASLAKQYRLSDCTKAYKAAFALLPDILWIGNNLRTHQKATTRINVASATAQAMSACIDLGDFDLYVEFLEQGMATSFQQLLQLKPDVAQLPQADANELQTLSSLLYRGITDNPHGVAYDRNKLLESIRKRPGFEYFLRPKPYAELCQASQNGPIIMLNSHLEHCDAIILLDPASKPVHVPLLTVSLHELEAQRTLLKQMLHRNLIRSRGVPSARLMGGQEGEKPIPKYFEDLLNWLWINIVQHIYKALESNKIVQGRIWWCPTGGFTGLPLHAAASTDQFVQSYTSTLGALLEAMHKHPSGHPPIVGLVGVTHSGPNQESGLPAVDLEIETIVSIVGQEHVQSLVGPEAIVEAVELQLQQCSWLHLACHGQQDLLDPPKSCLQLYGGALELETILRMSLPNAEIVFLAACQTAMGDATLVNESFHLAGGFITAGFRGAIGTLWSMADNDGPRVAETVYTHLFSGGRQPQATDAGKALQLAVRRMRDDGVPYQRWVPFIHMGV